jgi:Spy/CpxP family protein refolding chaperone
MAIGRNDKWQWVLAGLAMTGLAGGVLCASAQTPGGDSATDAAPTGPGDARGPHGPGGWERPGAGPHRMGQGFHRGGFALDRPLLMSFRRLDLTDEQWQRVQAILEVQQLRRAAGNETPEQRRAQIAALFDPGDPQHAAAVQAMKERVTARIDQATRTQQALYEVLTAEQKTHLQQLVAQRRQHMGERRQQRGRHGTGPGPGPDDGAPPAAPGQ